MTHETSARGTWYLVLIDSIAAVSVAGLISLQPHGSPLNRFIRGVTLLGYLAVFLTLFSSAHMRQAYRILVDLFSRRTLSCL